MNKLLLLLLGANFLPGFLSETFDSRTVYKIDKPFYNDYETDQIIAYELSSLSPQSRVKRQVAINRPSDTSSAQTTITKKPIQPSVKPVGTIWANKTRDLPSEDSSTPNLLRRGANVFQNQNQSGADHEATTVKSEDGTQIPFDNDDLYPPSPDEIIKEHNLTTNATMDDFLYYTVEYKDAPEGMKYWVDLDKVKHEMLSDAHRRAATLKPKFEFLFYGHPIPNLTIATGGFIYLGNHVHAWLAATQYVSPLMANFDSSQSKNATVSYLSTDTSFTVEWDQVHLQDSPDKGNFTFQTTLYKNGTIVFAYKNIAIPVHEINDTHHPVKVGLSDAYIRDRSLLVLKQKTIYEYHRIDVKDDKSSKIQNGSAIIFTLQETCLSLKTCEECTASKNNFDCSWCPKLKACSSGMDRNRQDWMQNNCDKDGLRTPGICPSINYNYNSTTSASHAEKSDDSQHPFSDHSQEQFSPETSEVQKTKATDSGGTSAGGVLAIMFFVIMVFASVGWLVYAYLYPHTPSGQLLIRYRPTQWAFRRGEARYTAASIHM